MLHRICTLALVVAPAISQAAQITTSAQRDLLAVRVSTGGSTTYKPWYVRSCGKEGRLCCPRSRLSKRPACQDGLDCVNKRCNKPKPPSGDGGNNGGGVKPCGNTAGERCCSGAADEAICADGLRCLGDADLITDNTCEPCGDEGEVACLPGGQMAIDPDNPPFFCNDDLEPVEDDNGATFCRASGGGSDPDPSIPPFDPFKDCGKEGENCCSQAADGPACAENLICDGDGPTMTDNTCKPCGDEDELACLPGGQMAIDPDNPPFFCNDDLEPVEDDNGATFCRASGGASDPDPSIPPFDPFKDCGKEGENCCSQAADGPACAENLVCDGDGPTMTDNTCKPCGDKDELACQSGGMVIDPSVPRFTCNGDLEPKEDEESGKTFCRSPDGSPPPPVCEPTREFERCDASDGVLCGDTGIRCCSQVADGPACGDGQACNRLSDSINDTECEVCGDEGQIACRPGDANPFDPGPRFCNSDDLEPVQDDEFPLNFFCRAKTTEPPAACPGVLGGPCCAIIADASSCGAGVVCSTEIPGPDEGKPTEEGTCVSCGGENEFACFELSIAGPSGPFCDEGLSADTSDPPKCVVGGMGPPCSGVLCPQVEPPIDELCGSDGQACCSQTADGAACDGGLACTGGKDGTCTPCGKRGQIACRPTDQNPRDQGDLFCTGAGLTPTEQDDGSFVCEGAKKKRKYYG